MLPLLKIRKKRIFKRRKHSDVVKNEIIRLCSSGMRSKDIYRESKERFGYVIKQSSISNILHGAGLAEKIRENSFVDPDKRKQPGWKKRLRELDRKEDFNKSERDANLERIKEESGPIDNLEFEDASEEDSGFEEDFEESEENNDFEPEFENYDENE